MRTEEFNYFLPKQLIAQTPAEPRDSSRLLILHKKTGEIKHDYFFNLPKYLQKGDLLVLNNSKVFPARLFGCKETGGKIEIFLLRPQKNDWLCLVGGRRLKSGSKIVFSKKLSGEIIKNNQDKTWLIKFNLQNHSFWKEIEKIGQTPLPPYIKRQNQEKKKTTDKNSYQTIYAHAEKTGSVAAPTAGFHFTKKLLNQLKKQGVDTAFVTLHVGLGTFAPVEAKNIEDHQMHSEWAEIEKIQLKKISQAKKEKKRIIAVGTTSVRTLENCWKEIENESNHLKNYQNWINSFIYPGYKWHIVENMITNFHLPKSTLLMLVSALAGKKNIDKAYQQALKKQYRFYSYGDAMLIID